MTKSFMVIPERDGTADDRAKARSNSQKSDAQLTAYDAAIIRFLIDHGFQHKRIAALYDINQGRIAEINTGEKFAGAVLTGGVFVIPNAK